MKGSKIKLCYVTGLKSIVLDELKRCNLKIIDEDDDSVFISYSEEVLPEVKKLRSVIRAYLVIHGGTYQPTYISNHKSILGNLIEIVIQSSDFKTYKINCAGSNSPEVRNIAKYVNEKYKLEECDEADLKIHIIKLKDVWEIGIQVTPRPLSVRDYRAINMSGAMDPTIAYAVNSLCNLNSVHSYLNVFSGSGTLLIEAAQCYPNLEKLIGFDNDKKHLTISIKNIKKAGLLNKVQVKEANIFNKPDFGTFDAITSDLPFGMLISKKEDLEKLYSDFIKFCENVLNIDGILAIYTNEWKIIETVLLNSRFRIVQSLQLKFITNVNSYLRPKIFICRFK